MKCVHYYEEDYCQIELIPASKISYVQCKLNEISNYITLIDKYGSSKDCEPFSVDYKEIEVNIPVAIFKAKMKRYGNIEKVFWGDSDNYVCSNVLAFGDSESIVVFAELSDETIRKVWLTLDIHNKSEYTQAKNLLNDLSSLADLLIVDWGWKCLVFLNQKESVLSYLESRLQVFGSHRN